MCPVSLSAKNISYKYDSYASYTLRHLNIEIQPGEHVAITGASGTGKTTLLKVLCVSLPLCAPHIVIDVSQ
ncbi:ATP-binding cassette domain-containing protein, partial [Klebsiella pneumoniae]|uniref:ATP-binding cassette domain-containing protein n=1 Tax=Klebsiella pneumoniae TaxID=573 RepID=UPI003968462C